MSALNHSRMWGVADTEDDSPDLLASGKSLFAKRCTQIAALLSNGETYYSRGDIVGFLRWLREHRPITIWFHNLRYDLGNLFGAALDVPHLELVGSRLIRARYGGIIFQDSLNLWPGISIERAGQHLGVAKGRLDPYSRRYVERDVKILHDLIVKTHELASPYGVDRLPATISGLAVKCWRALGGQNWQCLWAGSRQAYYGGRVELFRTWAQGDVHYLDMNSLYPWAMTQEFPATVESQKSLECCGVAHARVWVNPFDLFGRRRSFGPLPIRWEDGTTAYPAGRFEGVWTCAELWAAQSMGTVIDRVHSVYGSKETTRPYKHFVDHFFAKRQAAVGIEREFYKRLLNGLYGQLGMTGEMSVSRWAGLCPEPGVLYGDRMLCDIHVEQAAHVNYLHAAHVASYGRIRLLEHLAQVLGHHLIYSDTDSIIMLGKPPFATGDALGQFRVQARWKGCETISPKTYSLRSGRKRKFVAKGIPRAKASQFILDGRADWNEPFGLREAIIGYDTDNCKQLSVWHKVRKRMHVGYGKKILLDGHFYPVILDGKGEPKPMGSA